jgi:cytoskeletal protein RodZ
MIEEKSVLSLAAIRHNRGISLRQIADATKISIRSLEAIERGEFRKLPGGIYTTSYIRQYARAIDYDEGELLDFYRRETSGGTGAPAAPQNGGKGMFDGLKPVSGILGL